jgi:hypothetical protein
MAATRVIAASESVVSRRLAMLGGEGGIRTHGTVARTPHFECGAFDHSATSPLEQAFADRSRLLVEAGH